MRPPTPEQKQRDADFAEWRQLQRFEARRRQAQRALGAGSRARNSTQRSGARQNRGGSVPGTPLPVRASVIRHTPLPWLLAVVVSSLGGLFALAVVGAYAVIRTVFGQ